MNSSKVVVVLLIVCEQDSHNDPEEMVSKVVTEEVKPIQIKLENLKYEIDDFIHEERKRVRFGWHTRLSIRKISNERSPGIASGADAFKDN